MKKSILLFVLLIFAFCLTGCGEEDITINVAGLKGPTSIGMAHLIEQDSLGKTDYDYNFTIAGTADEITAGISNGEIQIAAVPCNLASVLYNKTNGGIKIAAINTLNVLYVIETGNTINSVADLKGKTIYSTGKGTTPEYTLNYVLSQAGIDPEKDVTIEFKSEATEVASILSTAENAVAMLPQPYVTTVLQSNPNARIAIDIGAEWEKGTNGESSVTTGVLIMTTDFIENHEKAAKSFLEDYEASISFVNKNVAEGAALVEKAGIFKAAIMEKAIPYCNIVYITGDLMKAKVNGYLNVLFEQNPKSVGGKMPGDEIFY